MSNKKIFWSLFALSLILELAIAGIIFHRYGFSYYQGGDAGGYMQIAKNLVEHKTFSISEKAPFVPSNLRTPAYPLFLALIYLIFHSFVPAIFLGVLITAFSAPLVYLIAKEIFPEKIALWSGILTALEPINLWLGGVLVTESIFIPVLLLSVYCFIKYLKTSKMNWLILFSALLGFSILIRPIAFYFWPLIIPFIFYREWGLGWREAWKKVLVSAAILFLILSPWLIRNKISVGSWQIAGIQSSSFFIDHYGAVLIYLGQANSSADVYDKAAALVGRDNILTEKGSHILFETALKGIEDHKLVYLNIYSKSLVAFFVTNGYKGLFIDILGLPAKAPYISFEAFLRFDFKTIFATFSQMNFSGFLIYWGGKAYWIILSLFLLFSLFYIFVNRNYQKIRPEALFLLVIIFYFALITGPTVVGGARTRAPVNSLIFILAVFGISRLLEFLKKKLA